MNEPGGLAGPHWGLPFSREPTKRENDFFYVPAGEEVSPGWTLLGVREVPSGGLSWLFLCPPPGGLTLLFFFLGDYNGCFKVSTFNQLVRRTRSPARGVYNRSPKMRGNPQRAGICLRVGTTKPKKPNSAIRKIAKVNLSRGCNVRAVIPGSGFDLQEHNSVLLQAGRARDIPGVHYKLIRNKLDLDPPFGFRRHQRRSKFGVANWAYVFRTPGGEPLKVVCSLRSRRHTMQSEWNLPLTWEKGNYSTQQSSRVEGTTLPRDPEKFNKRKQWKI